MRADAQGQPVREAGDVPGGLGRLSHQADVSVGILPTDVREERRAQGDDLRTLLGNFVAAIQEIDIANVVYSRQLTSQREQ